VAPPAISEFGDFQRVYSRCSAAPEKNSAGGSLPILHITSHCPADLQPAQNLSSWRMTICFSPLAQEFLEYIYSKCVAGQKICLSEFQAYLP
jgi:hypothetical protein